MKIEMLRPAAGLLLMVAAVLLVPLLAMQVTNEVVWTAADFVVAGALLMGTGMLYLAARRAGGSRYRLAVGVGLGAALLLVWANLAVGVIGDESNPANGLYLLVLAVGGLGTLLARLQPQGMARTLYAMAAVQAGIAGVAIALDLGGGAWEIVSVNAVFIGLFMVAARLFGRAAEEGFRADAAPAG
jgi:hypothetical protein